jgi:hypothetical protein
MSSHLSGRIVTLLAMPPAWVDFSWELVRGERDNVKNKSLLLLVPAANEHQTVQFLHILLSRIK